MIALLTRRPAFARLWLAGVISLVGDWLSFVAVSMLAVEHGGGALDLAWMLVAHTVPGALLSPVAGAFADRFDRRRLLVTAAMAQAALTVAMAFAALRGAVLAVQILVFVRGAVAGFVPPSEASALPRVVEQDELLPANALVSSTWSVAYVAGMALGGALATLGKAVAIGLDALSFVLAAALLVGLPAMPAPGKAVEVRAAIAAVPRDMLAAVRIAYERPSLLRAVLRKGTLATAGGASWLALNLVAASLHPFGSAALSLGVLQALRGAGTGVGPALASWAVRRGLRAEGIAHTADVVALGSMAIFIGASRTPAILAFAALSWGIGSGSNWVLSTVATQRLAPEGTLGRLTALDELFAATMLAASACIAARWIDAGATPRIAVLSSIGLGVLALVGLLGWTTRVRAPANA
ncbi:MAG: MFS transporter [Polyangiales bacterium]